MSCSDDFFSQILQRPSAVMAKVPFTPDAASASLPRLRAYIDETGDRGKPGGNSSPIFGMAAVVVDHQAETAARAVVAQLRQEFKIPEGVPLSWKAHLKQADRRVHAANLLSQIKELRVLYVVADKASMRSGTYVEDVTLFYNVVAYATLQRVLWDAKHGRGRKHAVEVRFGHVAKHPSVDSHNYFKIRQRDDRNVPFGLMTELRWVNATEFEMSQVADLYAGFLKAATWPSDYGEVDGSLLTRIWHQVRNSDTCPIHLGFQFRPSDQLARGMDWWPCECARCK